MRNHNCWKVLGIEPTDDINVINHAYAIISKTSHPEDNPEKFKIIHDAYKEAKEYALNIKEGLHSYKANDNDNSYEKTDLIDKPLDKKDILDYDLIINEGFDSDSIIIIDRIDELIKQYNTKKDKYLFYNFFNNYKNKEIFYSVPFINKLSDYLHNCKSIPKELLLELNNLYDFENRAQFYGDRNHPMHVLFFEYIDKRSKYFKDEIMIDYTSLINEGINKEILDVIKEIDLLVNDEKKHKIDDYKNIIINERYKNIIFYSAFTNELYNYFYSHEELPNSLYDSINEIYGLETITVKGKKHIKDNSLLKIYDIFIKRHKILKRRTKKIILFCCSTIIAVIIGLILNILFDIEPGLVVGVEVPAYLFLSSFLDSDEYLSSRNQRNIFKSIKKYYVNSAVKNRVEGNFSYISFWIFGSFIVIFELLGVLLLIFIDNEFISSLIILLQIIIVLAFIICLIINVIIFIISIIKMTSPKSSNSRKLNRIFLILDIVGFVGFIITVFLISMIS